MSFIFLIAFVIRKIFIFNNRVLIRKLAWCFGISNSSIIPSARSIVGAVVALNNKHDLSPNVKNAIAHFESKMKKDLSGIPGAGFALISIGVLKAEIEFASNNPELVYRTQAERAFIHLNRMLVVDKQEQQKWQDAFAKGETDIEKLGALHLLAHGLWAFKAHSAGERTDLIIQQNVNLDDVSKSMSTLVLTEWKVADKSNLKEKIEQATTQIEAYSSGSLAASELAHACYAIIVSEKHLDCPADIENNGKLQRFINIVVNPDTPSKR